MLYLSDTAAGAIGEAFGRRALARYHLADETTVCNMDDPRRLLSLGLRPSEIVSRKYTRTRQCARRIYDQKTWAGIKWWSYYNPEWFSLGLWDIGNLAVESIVPMRLNLLNASRTIVRRIIQ